MSAIGDAFRRVAEERSKLADISRRDEDAFERQREVLSQAVKDLYVIRSETIDKINTKAMIALGFDDHNDELAIQIMRSVCIDLIALEDRERASRSIDQRTLREQIAREIEGDN